MTTAIVWFRRDLRLTDNAALAHACQTAERVVPLYIHAPEEEAPWQPGAAACWWLHHSLSALDDALREQGSRLVICAGRSAEVLKEVAREVGAGLVCWNRLYEPAVRDRDAKVQKVLSHAGIRTHMHRGALLREPEEARKEDGTPYRVFTPFSRQYFPAGTGGILQMDPAPQDEHKGSFPRLPTLPCTLRSRPLQELGLLPTIPWHRQFSDHWCPGEAGAGKRLTDFLAQGVFGYGRNRNLPAIDGVSSLSPHLHFGEISPRQIWSALHRMIDRVSHEEMRPVIDRVQPFLRQLVWRDFAHCILYEYPHTPTEPFDHRYQAFPWEENPALLRAWQLGQTGVPLVDAGMRQLWATGWMHNRVRMVVATMLSKHGLVHWLEGARWFWDTLVDADLANNTMGWQWTVGCGVDAVPYFRILNPVRQGKRFDPDGQYVRTWVPELSCLPTCYLHEPWRAPPVIAQQAGALPGIDYPLPVVDLAAARLESLQRHRELRDRYSVG